MLVKSVGSWLENRAATTLSAILETNDSLDTGRRYLLSSYWSRLVYSLLVAIVAEIVPNGGADVDNIDQRGTLGEGYLVSNMW